MNEIKDHLGTRGPVIMAIKCIIEKIYEIDKTSLNLYSNGEYEAILDVD